MQTLLMFDFISFSKNLKAIESSEKILSSRGRSWLSIEPITLGKISCKKSSQISYLKSLMSATSKSMITHLTFLRLLILRQPSNFLITFFQFMINNGNEQQCFSKSLKILLYSIVLLLNFSTLSCAMKLELDKSSSKSTIPVPSIIVPSA